VFLNSFKGSESTAAPAGKDGKLRFEPMQIQPICGYNMADYFAHWLELGRRDGAQLPKVFMVNWFRKNDHGRFLWPGFGENSRVLAWVFERCDEQGGAQATPIGLVPAEGALDTDGLEITPEDMAKLLDVDPEEWRAQLARIGDQYAIFGDALPNELARQLEALDQRLNGSG